MSKVFKGSLLATTVIAGMSFAAPAFAQTTPAPSTGTTQPVEEQPIGVAPSEAVPPPTTAEGEIVVTGTLIRNPNLISASPVTVVGEEEIELQQSNVAEEILREIPGVVPSIGSAVNNGNGGASFVNLRGLGSNRNIVLLDGVRIVPGELAGRVDLNNIPLALIQRVDVLTGGASTTYGADAISGVVNFITRNDFAGVDLSLANSLTEEGDGHTVRADLTLGANFDDNRGNVVVSVGYQQADPVYQGARDVSIFNIDSFTGTSGGSGTAVPSRFSGVNPSGRGCDNAVVGGPESCAVLQGTRQVDAAGTGFLPGSAFTPFNFNPFNIFQTPFERFNLYSAGNYEISDAIEVYGRGLFSKNTVETIIAPSGSFGIPVNVPLNNPFLSDAQRNAICNFDTNTGAVFAPRFNAATCAAAANPNLRPGDAAFREARINVARRSTEAGPRTSEYVTTIFDMRVGARGPITSTTEFNVWGSHGQSENTSTTGGYLLNSRIRQSLAAGRDAAGNPVCFVATNDCVAANFFGPEGSISGDAVGFLVADSTVNTEVKLSQAHGTISGDVGFGSPYAAQPIGFAVGSEYRKYKSSQISDLLASSGDLAGAGGAAPNIDGGYNVREFFGEIIAPLVSDKPFFQLLQLEAGYRRSKYKVDAPGKPTFSTNTYKVSGKYEPVDGLQVRGGYARAARAPNIGELFAPVNTGLTNLTDDPCASLDDTGRVIAGRGALSPALQAVCIAQGAPAGSIGGIPQPTAGQANSTGGGNLSLKPETSKSYTIGTIFRPSFIPRLVVTFDYYNIKVKGAITAPAPDDVILACFGANPLNPPAGAATDPNCTGIRRDTLTGSLAGDSATVAGLPLTLSNLGKLATDGFDLVASYRNSLGPVGLAFSFQGNYTLNSKFQASPGAINRDCVGLYSINCGSLQPKYQFSMRTTATVSKVDVSLLWRHIDSMKYEFDDTAPAFIGTLPQNVGKISGKSVNFNKISAYNYFDLSTRFGITDNFTLVLLAENILNKKPPLLGSTIGSTTFNSGNTYPSTYDAVGRSYTASVRLKF